MQTVYLQRTDISRANKAEFRIKESGIVPGRVGLSLMTRVGLALLERELQKDEKKALDLVVKIARGDEL